MKGRSSLVEPRPLDTLESAIDLLRRIPASGHLLYLCGTVPFVLGFLFFWADMSRSPAASRHLSAASLGLAVAYVWMKTLHALYCRRLRSELLLAPPTALRPAALGRLALREAALQPLALVAFILSGIAMVPFGWVYAFNQSLTVLAGDEPGGSRALIRRAGRQAALWPLQNHLILAISSVAYLVVVLNVGLALGAGPHVLKTLLGVETAITRGGLAALNTTYLAAVIALSYVCCDPLIKATYTLRCFHGESLQTGEDLRSQLRSLPGYGAAVASIAVVLTLAVIGPSNAVAQTQVERMSTSIGADRLDGSIREVLERPKFAWRAPRIQEPSEDGMMVAAIRACRRSVKAMLRWMESLVEWIVDLLPRLPTPSPRQRADRGIDWVVAARLLGYVLLALSLAVLATLVWRARGRRRRPDEAPAIVAAAVPDLTSEATTADELPEESWLALARDLVARGELRLAVRAMYLASLAHLADRDLIQIARYKSNREYVRELARLARAGAETQSAFAATVAIFERVWYGDHDVDPAALAALEGGLAEIRFDG